MATTIEAYYTIYYGLGRYRYNSKPPIIGRRKVARKLGIPFKNIDIGITKDFPLWHYKKNKALLLIGRIRLAYDTKRLKYRKEVKQ